jgi:hypothetical protein
MPPFAMPSHKQHLVLNPVPEPLLVQTLDFTVEPLPLRQLGNGPRRISLVCAVYKAEIDRRLSCLLVNLSINVQVFVRT